MKKDFLIIFSIIILIVILACGVNIQSVENYYQTHIDEIKEDSKTVYLSISCKSILDNYDNLDNELKNEKYVPKDGIILKKTQFVLRPKDTVYDILNRVTKVYKIHMESSFSKKFNSVYIEGINHLYEFSCGPNSGWIYKVNNQFLNYGCSRYALKDKDNIEFIYTCDLGRDTGMNWSELK